MAELKAAVALLFRDLLSPGLSAAMSKITAASDAIGGGAAAMAADSTAAARAMDAAAGRMGAGYTGAARAIDAATGQIGGDLNRIGGGADRAAAAIEGGAAESAAAARVMDAAADRMGAGYTGAAREIDRATDQIGSDLTGAARTADAAADRIAGGADRAAQAWRAVDFAAHLGQASAEVTQLADGLGRAVNAGADAAIATDSALGRLGTVLTVDNTGGDVEAARQQVYEAAFAAATGQSEVVGELAAVRVPAFIDATFTGVSSGLSSVQAIAATERAAVLGAGTGADVGESSTLLNTLFNTFGDKQAAGDLAGARAEFARLADSVAQTQQLYAFEDLAQLGEGLKNAAGAALNFDVPLDQLQIMLGVLNTLGITGPEAGTAAAVAIEQVGKAARDLGFDVVRGQDGSIDMLSTIVREIEAGGFLADQISEAFGSEAGRAVGLLRKGHDLIAAGLQTDAAGASDRGAGAVSQTYAARLERLQSASEALNAELGRGSVAVRQLGVDAASAALSWLAGGAGEAREALAAFAGGALQVASAGAQGAAGALELSTGLLSATTLLGKTGPFARDGIGPLQRFGATLGRLRGSIFRLGREGIGSLQRFGSAAGRVGGGLGRVFGTVGPLVGGAAGRIGAGIGRMAVSLVATIPALVSWTASMWAATWPILAVIAAIALIAGGVYLIIRHWEPIAQWFSDLWERIVAPFRAAWDWLRGLFGAGGKELPETAAEGIRGSAAAVGAATEAMAGEATPYMAHSDAERGPLSRLTAAGRAIPTTIAAGMLAASPVLAAELPAALGDSPRLAALDGGALEAQRSADAPAGLAAGVAAPDASGRELIGVLRELVFELRAQRTGRSPRAHRAGSAAAGRQVHVGQVDLHLDETGDLFRSLEGLAEAAGDSL